jgi:ribose transport system substrate-binding protein
MINCPSVQTRVGIRLATIATLALGSAFLLFCSGCGRKDSETDRYLIGFSQCTVTEPWRVEFNKRLIALADSDAYKDKVKLDPLDAGDKTENQVAQVKTFIQRQVDAILVSPKEAAGLTDVVREATEAGIPVVVLDRDVHYDGYPCFIGGDNKVIGRAAGKVAVDMLGGPGQAQGVICEICGGLASTPGQERRDGFHEVVDQEPGITVIGGKDCDWKKQKAFDTFKATLKANDKIDLVYAHNDPMAHGAYMAAKEEGRASEMKFIGIDALPEEGIRWVKAGELTATLLYPTPGEKGLEVAVKILEGKEVPKRITLPTRVYTAENVDQGGEEVKLD